MKVKFGNVNFANDNIKVKTIHRIEKVELSWLGCRYIIIKLKARMWSERVSSELDRLLASSF